MFSYEVAGLQVVEEAVREKDIRLTFDAEDHVTVRVKDGNASRVEIRGTYKLDAAADPKTIDLTVTPPGRTKQVRMRGIYALKDDRVSAVFGLPGTESRPAGFDVDSAGVIRVSLRLLNRNGGTAVADQAIPDDRLTRLLDSLLDEGRTDTQVVEALLPGRALATAHGGGDEVCRQRRHRPGRPPRGLQPAVVGGDKHRGIPHRP